MLVYTNINVEFIRLIITGYVIPTKGKFRSNIGPLESGANSIDFGNLFQDSIGKEIIPIFNSTEDTIHIKPQNTFDHIEITVEPEVIKPGQSGEVFVQFSSTKTNYGKLFNTCEFSINIKDNKHTGKLVIMANVVEDFSILTEWEKANPPEISTGFCNIDLGEIEPNKLTTKILEIENIGKRELLIHNITTTNSMYSIKPLNQKIEPGNKGIFQLSIKPSIKRNNIASKLTIISNDPEKSVQTFTLVGKVILSKDNNVGLKNTK